MASIVIRNLPDEVHRALRIRAAENGRSTEAEVRQILEQTVLPKESIGLGSALAAIGAKYKFDLDVERGKEPPRAASFE